MSDVRLVDCGDWSKVLVRAAPKGALAQRLSLPDVGQVRWQLNSDDDLLVVGHQPDGWLVLSATATANSVIESMKPDTPDEFVSRVDVTHGYWLGRLTGPGSAAVLANVCAIDLSDAATPLGSAFGSLVAGVRVTVIRDDLDVDRSYLLMCDRSYGRYLRGVLTDITSASE